MGPTGTDKRESTQLGCVPGAKALVVHEDLAELRYYRDILQGFGFGVQVCNSYKEGVQSLADEVFHFVIVSQGTPNFEGMCVLKRAIVIDRRLPVLVVARCLDMACYLEAMQLGAVDYLVEPLKVSEITR